MEFFGALFGLILLIVLIVVGIGIIAFPIIFDLALHDAYYEYPLCVTIIIYNSNASSSFAPFVCLLTMLLK